MSNPRIEEITIKEQDRLLPAANVGRMMKKMLPHDVKIEKNTKDFAALCVSEFISFITSEASDKCHQEKRKTLNGEDIVWALHNMGMENYVEPLRIYLTKYRESRNDKMDRPDKRPKLTIEDLAASANFDDPDAILRSVWNPSANPVRKDKGRTHSAMMSGGVGSSSSHMKSSAIDEDDDEEEEEEEEDDED
jgi:nuclear transcription Y subunit beta